MKQLGALGVAATLLAACSGGDGSSGPADGAVDGGGDGGSVTPAVTATDQTLGDVSMAVTVDRAVLDRDGFVVVYDDDGGAPGEPLGAADTDGPGTFEDMTVVLRRPAEDGETLWAVLLEDVEDTSTRPEPGSDPMITLGGSPVASSFVATVPSGTPAIRLTLDPGDEDYALVGIEPASLLTYSLVGAGLPTLGGDDGGTDMPPGDPDLTLMPGWRFEIVNLGPVDDPLELVTDNGAGSADDDVQATQQATIVGSTPPLEDDTSVAWEEPDLQTVRFTVSPSFMSAVDTYRSGTAPDTLRGGIGYASGP